MDTDLPPGPALTRRFEEALVYAKRLHDGQLRKGSDVPYVSHLLAVCGTVLEAGGGEDEAIGALLHDAAEDQGGRARLEAIREKFGEPVAEIVEGCSDTLETPKPPWRGRKERHLRELREARPEVLRVALADKLHNARAVLHDLQDLGDRLWQRFTSGPEDQLWYYRSAVALFRERMPGTLTEELARVVDRIDALAGR